MNTMEVLTLLPVIFTALSYIDDHNNKKKKHPTRPSRCYFKFDINSTEGKSESYPIHLFIDLITKFMYNFVIRQGGVFMPTIKSSADLRNNYNEISTFCHNYPEPVFITKNGKGDLAVMSIEAYEELTSRFELYSQIKEGIDDIATGNIRPFSEAMADIRSRRSR